VVVLWACLLKYEEFDPYKSAAEWRPPMNTSKMRQYHSQKNMTGIAISQLGHQNQLISKSTDQQTQQGLVWQHAPYHRAEMHEESLKHEAVAD
jgi:hypothetical protein